ncbi:pyrimidine/purine nucleoside phosphorylase [Vibrio scophthalmi]|uniref:Pyrimidine/purine nucleoside phosphorylase n=2 Tax=Vibrio scophthalmi TaxID=45658 RepID=A0A1B1NTY8_9VIBR|nr:MULTISPECIES: pyrimidine/purine nucleoside phosphorylase [Vibrio]ANS87197.1 UPF0345 protein [Vibrio scophthalmi]ANU39305.1 UPF0345 protein [Vibrio scophthalmi]EGU36106.1 hypothetical protein VIBRN418_08967 [Vibrio sp. N418]EGU37007.1 hypothetical protein VIS19158_17841 [Vibrio scophthalmi LMG 19158]MCY9802757.1 pyrimidine/purine nucleoside phosphorylase [Vibrio scophthalmi]
MKHNVYFEGNVQSLAFTQLSDESSVGVMAPGEYTFGTASPEKMTVIKGALTIKREGELDWTTFKDGESFNVSGDSSFELRVEMATAYFCEYL